MHLAELELNLKDVPVDEGLAELLRRDFANLQHALHADTVELVEVAIRRLYEDLATVAMTMFNLADKCADLQSQLDRLSNLFEEESDGNRILGVPTV